MWKTETEVPVSHIFISYGMICPHEHTINL